MSLLEEAKAKPCPMRRDNQASVRSRPYRLFAACTRLALLVEGRLARVAGCGWGQYSVISGSEAMAAAKVGEPRPLSEGSADHLDVGQWVTVTPLDTGRVPVTGTLVSRSEARIVVARRSEDVGLCHVHFPVSGFECSVIN